MVDNNMLDDSLVNEINKNGTLSIDDAEIYQGDDEEIILYKYRVLPDGKIYDSFCMPTWCKRWSRENLHVYARQFGVRIYDTKQIKVNNAQLRALIKRGLVEE